ncbi:MAG: phage/plasmid primase, P4 family [Candidatus Pacebacteria bacterium]|nr:phage/plasmid primase, P4 family [Candidatus Paceibacterota bacterium]
MSENNLDSSPKETGFEGNEKELEDIIGKNKEIKEEKRGKVFTKIGQAEAFIKEQPLFYSPEGIFWFWNAERYCYEMKDEVDLLNGIRKEMGIDTITNRTKAEILTALKQVGREQSPKEKPKGWIQFLNTLVNPKTGEKVEASHEYFLTNPIPHKLGESEEAPELDKLLHQWAVRDGVQDESYVQSLYEYLAYSLTDDLFMQRVIALTGGGSNGKGTFLKVIEKLVGSENCVAVELKKLSSNDFAKSAIYKKLVAFAGEVGYGDLSNTNTLKMLTGEDKIEYEFKGKNSFSAPTITTIIISTNSLPTTPDRSMGFYRRWAITDFPNRFEIKSDVILVVSEQEYENLCLKCVNTLKKLYETHQFTNEGNYDERERRYEERSNPLPKFIEENYEDVVGENTKLQDFTVNFNLWLREKRLRLLTIKQVGQMVRSEGYIVGKRKQDEDSFVGIVNLALRQKKEESLTSEEKYYAELAEQEKLLP